MKKRFSLFILLSTLFICLVFGCTACKKSNEDGGRDNPMIIVETDKTEVSLDIWESDYTIPLAGVYYENLDRVDGTEIRMSLKDPTGAYIYEDNALEYISLRFPFTGKYELIYKAKGCKDVVITIYVCERLEMSEEFTLENGTLTWEDVYGAVGYEITVNGEEPVFTSSASFTSDIFEKQGFYVGITAKGDNKEWVDSYMVSYENRIPLKDGELAAFNNPCYALDIGQAEPSDKNAPPEQIQYLTEEECAGSTDGAVRFLLKSGEHGPALFRVQLENAIDKNADFDGMEIRFKLDTNSYVYKPGEYTTRFILAYPNADARPVSRGTYVYEGHNDSWQIVKIPKSAVDGFDGLNYLQFSLFNMVRSNGKGFLYLDYIRLYKDEIVTPTNVAIDGDKLHWDSVENACEYMISVDKVNGAEGALEQAYFYATEAESALSTLGIDVTSNTQQYEIKVMAVSGDTSIGSSAWSEKVIKRGEPIVSELSPMDNAIYTLDVTNALTHQHVYWKSYEMVTGAEGKNAVRMALNADSDYGTISCFTINLPKPLDLDGEFGSLSLRLKLEATNYASLDTLTIQFVGKNATENYGSGMLFRQAVVVGEWMDYQMSVEDLKSYYETGDTQLSFQITNTVANKSGGTVYMTVALDYLRYCRTVDIPANVRVEGTTLKWDPVEDASCYTVNLNGETYTDITETSFDLSGLTDLNTLKVRAESANEEKGPSSYCAEVYYQVVEENVIASFDNANYAGLLSYVPGEQWARFKETPSFNKSGTPEGTVSFGVMWDDYRGGTSDWSRLAAFTVTLPKSLNLESDYAGVKIKLHINEMCDVGGKIQKVTLELLDNSQKASWNDTASAVSLTIGDGQSATTGWMELFITNEQLKDLGYATGDTILTFGIRATNSTNASVGNYVKLAIDYIEYATADEFGTEEPPTEEPPTVELAENELANFNTADYVSSISNIAGYGREVGQYPYNGEPTFDGVEAGTVSFRIFNEDYRGTGADWTKLAAFTVTLPKALDLTSGYAGIKIKLSMKVNEPSSSATLEMLAKGKNTKWNDNASTISVTVEDGNTATWVELFITNEQLEALGYATGDTVLTFGIRGSTNRNTAYGNNANISIDYIEYATADDFGTEEPPTEEPPTVELAENELANFNTANYASSISNVAGIHYSAGQYPYNGEPSFETQEIGTIYFRVYNDDYRNGTETWTNLAAFTVTLPKALDLASGYAGIKIKLQMKVNEPGSATLEMLAKDKNTEWNQNPSGVSVTVEDGNTAAVWVELYITNAQLTELGYATGDTVLAFGIRNSTKRTSEYGNNANISIDYIEYYSEGN